MESALRILDEYTQIQVFRAREDTRWRADPKRAALDALCADCRVLDGTDYCYLHVSKVEAAIG